MIGDPKIPVECDLCGEVEEFGLTALACNSWDARGLEHELKRLGWMARGDEYYCPDCVEEMEEHPEQEAQSDGE